MNILTFHPRWIRDFFILFFLFVPLRGLHELPAAEKPPRDDLVIGSIIAARGGVSRYKERAVVIFLLRRIIHSCTPAGAASSSPLS